MARTTRTRRPKDESAALKLWLSRSISLRFVATVACKPLSIVSRKAPSPDITSSNTAAVSDEARRSSSSSSSVTLLMQARRSSSSDSAVEDTAASASSKAAARSSTCTCCASDQQLVARVRNASSARKALEAVEMSSSAWPECFGAQSPHAATKQPGCRQNWRSSSAGCSAQNSWPSVGRPMSYKK